MACTKQSHPLERATARLAKAVRNIEVEYSGRSRQVALRYVAPHGIAWADAWADAYYYVTP